MEFDNAQVMLQIFQWKKQARISKDGHVLSTLKLRNLYIINELWQY